MNSYRAIRGFWTGLDLALVVASGLLLALTLGLTLVAQQQAAGQRTQGAELVLGVAEQQSQLRVLAGHATPAALAAATGLEPLHRWRADGQRLFDALSRQVRDLGLAALGEPLHEVARRWDALVVEVDRLLASEAEILALREQGERLAAALADLVSRLEGLAEQQIGAGGAPVEALITLRLLTEAQGLVQTVERQRGEGLGSLTTPAQLAAGIDRLAVDLARLRSGDRQAAAAAEGRVGGRVNLQGLAPSVAALGEDSATMLGLAQRLTVTAVALAALPAAEAAFADSLDALGRAYATSVQQDAGPVMAIWTWVWLGAISLTLTLGLLARRSLMRAGRPTASHASAAGAEQGAILRLLDEIGGIAEGDLTVAATPGDDLTGAIADAFNQAIAALRRMVTWGSAAVQVLAQSIGEIRSLASRLSATSALQGDALAAAEAALGTLQTQAASLAQRRGESVEVAARLGQVAARGAQVLREALRGIDGAGEQARVAATRLQRLNEAVVEIGALAAAIDDLADQTDILAVNGAMLAAGSGEAGRDLVGLIDEVRQLASQTREAVRQVQAVLRNMTADAAEATSLVETGATDLRKGADQVEDAGGALAEVETVVGYIDELMRADQAADGELHRLIDAIRMPLGQMQDSRARLAVEAEQAGGVITALTQPVQELKRAVGGFRLAE